MIAAAVLLGRVLVKQPIRRELAARPLLALVVVAAGIAGVALAVSVSVQNPLARRAGVLLLAVVVVACVVRARPNYGRRRRLPAGSLGLSESLDAIHDPDYYSRTAARLGPVFKMSQLHQPVVCITDLRTGIEFFHENEDRLVQSEWSFNRLVPGGYLEYTNGDAHTRLRGMLAPRFTREVVEAARPVLAEVTRTQLAAMARASHPSGVHPEPFLLPVVQVPLLRMILGIGPDHPQSDAIRQRFTDLNRPLELFLPVPRASREAFDWLSATIALLVREREIEAAGGRVGTPSVLADLASAYPSMATDETAIGNLVLMIKEGSIMTRGLLRWIIKMLADHPAEVEQIRAAAGDAGALDARARAFVQETIRLYESPYLYRRVAQKVPLGEYRIPEGWLVRLCLTEAHARPDVFPEPHRFEPSRFLEQPVASAHHCPFGSGDRACPGADIAIEIAKTVVQQAALDFDLRAVDDGAAWRINRHWGLWRPSLRLRVTLESATAGGRVAAATSGSRPRSELR